METESISQASELLPIIQVAILTNPLKVALGNATKEYTELGYQSEDAISAIKEYEERLLKNKILLNITKQKRSKTLLAVKHLEKSLENSASDLNIDWLTRDKMNDFFKRNNLDFVDISFSQYGDNATLTFIRPPKMIGCLPVPPFIVQMKYGFNVGGNLSGISNTSTLVFTKAEILNSLGGNLMYVHPHISGSTVCMGNYFDILNENNYSLLLEGYQEHVILLDNLLSTYNPDSPYRSIDEILSDCLTKGYTLKSSTTKYYHYPDSSQTISAYPKETHYSYYQDLIGEKHFRDFYKLYDNVSIISVVEDMIIRFGDMKSNDPHDDYTYLDGLETQIMKLFNNNTEYEGSLSLMSLGDYATYDNYEEDSEGTAILESDSFNDLLEQWIIDLKEFKDTEFAKKAKLKPVYLPDLDLLFEIEQPSNDLPF